MKFLKPLLIGLGVFIALVLIVGLIQPTTFSFERSVSIDASPEVIFAKINDLKAWEEWGPWAKQDSTLQVTYGEKTVGVGASYSWSGDEKLSGKGKLTITESKAPEALRCQLEFGQGGTGEGWFRLEPTDSATITYWGMSFGIPYPFNAFSILSMGQMEKSVNDMLDMGLSELKKVAENAAAKNFDVQQIDYPGQKFLLIRKTVSMREEGAMQRFFSESFGKIAAFVAQHNAQMAGMPCGLYFTWDESTGMTDMAAAIPVGQKIDASSEGIEYLEIPASKALLIDYYGDYSDLGAAHQAMDAYLSANDLEHIPPVIEQYVTDPGAEPDSNRWLTKVIYLLKPSN